MLTKNDLSKIRNIVQEEISLETTPVKKSLAKIEKKLDKTIDYFDDRFLNHEKRLKNLEDQPQIKPLFR